MKLFSVQNRKQLSVVAELEHRFQFPLLRLFPVGHAIGGHYTDVGRKAASLAANDTTVADHQAGAPLHQYGRFDGGLEQSGNIEER